MRRNSGLCRHTAGLLAIACGLGCEPTPASETRGGGVAGSSPRASTSSKASNAPAPTASARVDELPREEARAQPAWRRGLRVGPAGGVIANDDWVAENKAASRLLSGLEGCRVARVWQNDQRDYRLEILAMNQSQLDEAATARLGGDGKRSEIPVGSGELEATFWLDHDQRKIAGAHFGVRLPTPPQPKRDMKSEWQDGPFVWLADFEQKLALDVTRFELIVVNDGGKLRVRPATATVASGVVETKLSAWAEEHGFERGEAGGWSRARDDFHDAIEIDGAALTIRMQQGNDLPTSEACTDVATTEDDAVAPTRGAVSVGSPTVAGGAVSNASSVVARLRGRFRACYNAGLKTAPALEGSMVLVAKIGKSGEVQGVSGESAKLKPIVACLKAVVSTGSFAAPDKGTGAVISIPVTFVQQ